MGLSQNMIRENASVDHHSLIAMAIYVASASFYSDTPNSTIQRPNQSNPYSGEAMHIDLCHIMAIRVCLEIGCVCIYKMTINHQKLGHPICRHTHNMYIYITYVYIYIHITYVCFSSANLMVQLHDHRSYSWYYRQRHNAGSVQEKNCWMAFL